MNSPPHNRLGLRVSLAAGAVLFVIGGLLLSIVGDPPRTRYGIVAAVGILGIGCVFIFAGFEAYWRPQSPRLTFSTVIRALVIAALLFVGAGLLVQLLYGDQRAFTSLVSGALPLVGMQASAYLIAHLVLARLAGRRSSTT